MNSTPQQCPFTTAAVSYSHTQRLSSEAMQLCIFKPCNSSSLLRLDQLLGSSALYFIVLSPFSITAWLQLPAAPFTPPTTAPPTRYNYCCRQHNMSHSTGHRLHRVSHIGKYTSHAPCNAQHRSTIMATLLPHPQHLCSCS